MLLFGPPSVEKLKARRDVRGLVQALDYTKDPSIQRQAAAALGDIREESALWPLQDALWHPEVCREAAVALGKLGDLRALAGLGSALGRERGYVTKCEIIKVLGKFDSPEVIDLLVAALDDQNLDVRITASRELTRLGWRPEAGELERLFARTRTYDAFRTGRYDEIGERRNLLPREAIHAGLGGSDSKARQFAARVLGETGGPEAFNILIQCLERETQDIRVVNAIVDGLAKFVDPLAIEPMLHAYQRFEGQEETRHDIQGLQSQIASALVAIGEGCVDVCSENLNNEAVIDALSRMSCDKAADLLIRAVTSVPDINIVVKAAHYLGESRAERAVGPLCQALKRVTDAACLDSIAEALRRIGDPWAVPSLVDVFPEIVAQSRFLPKIGGHPEVVHALIAMGEPVGEPLRKLLEEETLIHVREEIEYVLEQIRFTAGSGKTPM